MTTAGGRSARATDIDIPRLLGITGPGAWVLAALYCVTYLTLAAVAGGPPMQTVEGTAALVAVLVTAVLLVVPWRYPLPLPLVAWSQAVVVFSTVAICWHLAPTGWPGWSSWNFGADTFLMFLLALRGRFWWGAIGLVLMSLLTIHWTFATTGDWWHGFDLTYRQLATYLAGGFFAVWLRRTASRIAEFQETERRQIAAEQAQDATAEERQRQLDRVRRVAGPALTQIAGGEVSAESRRDHGLLEADLRDQIRGRSLAVSSLSAAIRAARVRGIEVAVLDDLRDQPPSADDLESAIEWSAARIAGISSGSATIRLARVDGVPAVTFATADGGVETFSLSSSRAPAAAPGPPG